MEPDGKWLWWVVSWMINVGWFAIAIGANNIPLAIGAGIFTIILIVWDLPGTTSGDD